MQGQGKKQSIWSYSCRVNKPSPRAHPAKQSLLLDETQGDGTSEWAVTRCMRCMLQLYVFNYMYFIAIYMYNTHFASVQYTSTIFNKHICLLSHLSYNYIIMYLCIGIIEVSYLLTNVELCSIMLSCYSISAYSAKIWRFVISFISFFVRGAAL